jgi:alpha-D-xyloside xylohydrolase
VKFTDGYWQMRAGLTAHFPEQVYEVDVEPDGLTVYAPTRRLTHRGDTLNTPMVSVRVSSPMHNVARIEIQHHKGRRRSKPPSSSSR